MTPYFGSGHPNPSAPPEASYRAKENIMGIFTFCLIGAVLLAAVGLILLAPAISRYERRQRQYHDYLTNKDPLDPRD